MGAAKLFGWPNETPFRRCTGTMMGEEVADPSSSGSTCLSSHPATVAALTFIGVLSLLQKSNTVKSCAPKPHSLHHPLPGLQP